MIKFYFSGAPNPVKVGLFLEEAGLEYEPIPVDTRRGDQFKPDFLAINPNGKVPAIVDGDATVFDSGAILLYLGEKTGQFMPANTPKARGDMLSWMMFIASGVGPFSGQAVHFKHYAPADVEYARKRYLFEVERHYAIINTRLGAHRYMLGNEYTLVDMALWGWARMLPFVLGDDAWTNLAHVKRFVDEVGARPAAAKALALKDKFTWKVEMDAEARKVMFRHLDAKAALRQSDFIRPNASVRPDVRCRGSRRLQRLRRCASRRDVRAAAERTTFKSRGAPIRTRRKTLP